MNKYIITFIKNLKYNHKKSEWEYTLLLKNEVYKNIEAENGKILTTC